MALDFTEISDKQIAGIDILRIRNDVSVRYGPVARTLIWIDNAAKRAHK